MLSFKSFFTVFIFCGLIPSTQAQDFDPVETKSVVQAPTTSAANVTPATAETKTRINTSATPIPADLNVKAVPYEEIQFSNWGSSYFNLSVVDQAAIGKRERPNVFMYQYVSLNYRMSRDNRLFFRPSFGYNTSGIDERGQRVATQLKTEDFHMGWSTYNWLKEPIKIDTSIKVYLPTSASSREKDVIVKFRPEVKMTWEFMRYSFVQYMVKPDFYYTRNATYLDDRGRASATRQYELEHYVETTLDISRSQAVKFKVGFEEEWKNGSNAESIKPFHKTDSVIGIGYEIRPFRKFNTTLFWSNVNEVVNTSFKPARRFGHPDDNEFVLLTNVSLF